MSPDFLVSKYVREVEFTRAFQREKAGEIIIVPIVIYPNIRLKEECPKLLDFQPLPAKDQTLREFEGERGDYGDAYGLIRAGLRQAIDKVIGR